MAARPCALERARIEAMRAAGESVDDFPVLQAGESVTVRGYTVTVTAADGDTHTITIVCDDS